MYVNLTGLNIILTGATRGIGKALAIKLAHAGATIAIHYNTAEREAHELAEVLGNESKPFCADFSDPREASRLFDQVVQSMGSVDILINNAGAAISSDMTAEDEEWMEVWNTTMNINLNSAAILCKKAIQHFLDRNIEGRIINISSRAAFRGEQPEFIAYGASKSGMVSLTKTIAKSYGKSGIKAFTIAPGFVRSDMSQDFIRQYGEGIVKDDLALDRLTEPRDIAPLVTFIASGLADHATGATFDLNAGSYLR